MPLFYRPAFRSRVLMAAASLLVLLAAAPLAAQTPPQRIPPPASAGSVVAKAVAVTLDISVTDAKGNLVTGLKRGNFTLTENNVEQELRVFEPNDTPLNLVILVEFSRSTLQMVEDMRDAAYLMSRTVRPTDYLALVSFGSSPRIEMDFTQDRDKMEYKIATLQYTAFAGVELIRALDFVLDRLSEVDGRKAVVLLATGLTSSPVDMNAFAKRARVAAAPIFPVSMGRHERNAMQAYISENAQAQYFQADFRLKKIAEASNGVAYFPAMSTAFPATIKDILQRLRHRYVLTYVPTEPEDVKRKRKIAIEAKADLDGDGKPDKLVVQSVRELTLEDLNKE